MGHAILNPSSSKRWLTCLGSAGPHEDQGSEYADEGTAAHQLASDSFNDKRAPASYVRQTIAVANDDGTIRRIFDVTEEMADNVAVYVNAINDRTFADTIPLYETRVDSGLLSVLYGAVDGTADAILIQPSEKTIEVHDLKYGQGIQVKAAGNTQLRLYGMGAVRFVRDLGFDLTGWKVRMCIHQPRRDHFDEETLTVAELESWCEWAQSRINEIDSGVTTLTPDEEACRWCPLKASCTALSDYTMSAVFKEFEAVADISDYGLGKALDKIELIEQWCSSIREAAVAEIEKGGNVTGWKLGEGREGNRKWKTGTPLVVTESLKRPVVMTPPQAEKALKTEPERWAALQQYIERAPGKPTLMRDTDTRATVGSVLSYFPK